MIDYLGGPNSSGKSLASISLWSTSETVGAISNDQSSNNKSGFTAYPSGYRNPWGGEFISIGDKCYWWSSTSSAGWGAYFRILEYKYSFVDWNEAEQMYGFSVRCVKNN